VTKRSIISLAFLSLTVLGESVVAPRGVVAGPAWDLSYQRVLADNHVKPNEWLAEWLRVHRSAPMKEVSERVNEVGVRSAILLEYPAFHAGERLTFLVIRTDVDAYAWNFVDGKSSEYKARLLDPNGVDSLVAELFAWVQGPPLNREEVLPDVPAGYFAFLSIYAKAGSRQILLTRRDFKDPSDPRGAKPGRVIGTFGRVIRLYD
jgi:hypothetical protein